MDVQGRSPHPWRDLSRARLWPRLFLNRRIEDMILPSEVEGVVRELVEEQHRADLLRSYNLEPRIACY